MKIKKAIYGALYQSRVGPQIAKQFWKEIKNAPFYHYLYRHTEEVFKNLPIPFENKEIAAFIRNDSEKWRWQEEFVVAIPNVLIEPHRGLGIHGLNGLIYETKITDQQYPYIVPYLVNRNKAQPIETAILYDGSATLNYYHHFVNALNSLHMLEKVKLPSDIPLLITKACFETPYFQYIYQRSTYLKSLNWLVQQPNQWFLIKELYRLQCVHFSSDVWEKTKRMYALPPVKPYRKVFLSRDAQRYGRGLINEKEISTLLRHFGFETVYAEHLTIEQQTELFRNTKCLVALHGAGLVQQFFMNNKEAHVLEIMPNDRMMPLYYWQSFALKIKYFEIVLGSSLNKSTNYYLSPEDLKKAVVEMLKADGAI